MQCRSMRLNSLYKKMELFYISVGFTQKTMLFIYLFIVSGYFSLDASHNTSRYFPFLERPAEYVLKRKSHFSPSLFQLNICPNINQ